jgi:RecA-family ATPase
VPEPTPVWAALLAAAKAASARLAIIDTAADVFAGNENRRDQVRQFIQGACTRLAREIDGVVLLCAHPSAAGLASGSGTSGSTGWSNSVRSRLYLHAPKADEDDEADADARILTSKKSNYGRRGQEILMHWRDGVFVLDNLVGPDHVDRIDAAKRADDAFLAALDGLAVRGMNVSHAPGRNYAPTTMIRWQSETVRGHNKSALASAMDRLIRSGRILCNVRIKTGPDRKPLNGLARAGAGNAGNPIVTH